MSMEDLCVKKIESGIRGIRMGTKNPDEVRVGYFLEKLLKTNVALHDDFIIKYMKVMKVYKARKNN